MIKRCSDGTDTMTLMRS